jgi:3-deoxy-D-manno-octulosonic-acid transferase
VPVAGNLKFDVSPPPDLLARGRAWRDRIGGRQVLLCASTREGEEAQLLAAWTELHRDRRQGILLAIVPRHPQRFDDVAALALQHRAHPVEAQHGGPDDGSAVAADVLLGDSMGEMSRGTGLADLTVIGGSAAAVGAQNLIEACAAGVPVILGPHTFNFAQAAQAALQERAAVAVDDASMAIATAMDLLEDPARRVSMAQAAVRFAQAHQGATGRTMALLEPLFSQVGRPHRP